MLQVSQRERLRTIISGHHESLVDFAMTLGLDREYVMNYEGAPLTKNRAEYFEHISRSKPWDVRFAAVCSGEMTRGTKMYARVGERFPRLDPYASDMGKIFV